MRYLQDGNRLIAKSNNTIIWVEAWGENSLRVRMAKEALIVDQDWALLEEVKPTKATIAIEEVTLLEPWYEGENEKEHEQRATVASIQNGNLIAKFNAEGWLSFTDANGKELLSEYWRNRNRIDRYCAPLNYSARELKPILGTNDYSLIARFEAYEDEKIFGCGQYQEMNLDKKGAILELAHRNTQASIPFMVSSRGYGFLWNNPAIGQVAFGVNKTEWTADSTKQMDYWITAGDTPAQIVAQYADVTGKVPMMPEYGMGFWQCKLRYRNQEELLTMVREHKRRGLPMDVVVIDFFHWTKQGDFMFDPVDWPDPEAMIKELKSLGVELMVSVWPTIDSTSINRGAMDEEGLLIRFDRGLGINMNWMGETAFFDATNERAQQFVWDRCKENYYDKGVKLFWLDEAEPEFGIYDFDLYRYHIGPAKQVTNVYPKCYSKAFYDGMKASGDNNVMNLVRCAWAGSQRYGALVWSGDISSTFRALREQLQAGLNVGLAGIPWWTTDIGGFIGGDVKSDEFRELLIRWFEWATFCPVMRLHGERQPFYPLEEEFRNGVRQFSSGQDNEVWSYGEDNYEIMKHYMLLREQLRPYIRKIMQEAHELGSPVMRTMFYEFPQESICWELTTQYMFGSDILVAPVMEYKQRSREVYLPSGLNWVEMSTKKVYPGGQTITVNAPLSEIPVFIRETADII